jgi:diacylglycerol kinase
MEGVLFKVSRVEWLFIAVAIGAVLGFEILNSAVERLASKYSAQQDPEIGLIKDAAAAGVLVASAAAAVIGFVIFMSRILRFLL